jgi:hypothetical protein
MIETLASEQGLAIVGLEALTIRRVRCGRGFSYRNGKGCVRDASELARLKSLAVPPAYVDVRYAADPAAHLQAVGTDAAGRLQYRWPSRSHPSSSHSYYVTACAQALAHLNNKKSIPRLNYISIKVDKTHTRPSPQALSSIYSDATEITARSCCPLSVANYQRQKTAPTRDTAHIHPPVVRGLDTHTKVARPTLSLRRNI